MNERIILTASFSRLKDYERCPYMLWLKAGERRSTEHVDTSAMDRGTEIHQECEDYTLGKHELTKNMYKFGEYFQDLRQEYLAGNVLVEEEWGFDVDWQPTGWWDKDVKVRMKLDNFRVIARDENNNPVAGIPTDYKTGKKFGNEVGHNQQGVIYAIGSFLKMPTLEYADVEFLYLDHGLKSKPKRYTREKAMKLLPSWQARFDKLFNDREFRPKANKINCKYCAFSPNEKGDGSCPWGVES
jgi:CRISPR/Cas system-associated exonuclease Cas4 (RecB family)